MALCLSANTNVEIKQFLQNGLWFVVDAVKVTIFVLVFELGVAL